MVSSAERAVVFGACPHDCSWDTALDEIATRFKQIIAEYGAEAIMPYSYLGHEGLLNGLPIAQTFICCRGFASILCNSLLLSAKSDE